MVTNIQGKELEQAVGHWVVVRSFSGARTRAMKDYLKPDLEHEQAKRYYMLALEEVAESIVDLALQIESSCNATVTISELVCRKGKVNQAVSIANKHFIKFCHQNE